MVKGIISRSPDFKFFGIRTGFAFMFVAGLSLSMALQGQDPVEFKPGGKVEARIFTGFITTFADGESHSKFDLGRAYLGYSYNFTRTLSGRIVYDVADPAVGKLKFTGMLKFGYLRYKTDKWTISGGMIPLPEYDYTDKMWGYRYVFKPSHDEYGFGVSADLGLSVSYKIAPWLLADAILVNGEGFKLTESDSTLKTGLGITVIPVRNVSLHGYYDRMGKDGTSQQSADFMVTYENKGLVFSAVYHYLANTGLIVGRDLRALSFNGTVPVNAKTKLFGRYDFVSSVRVGIEDEAWNLNKDGQLFVAGIEFVLAPGVNLAPNYQGWIPADGDMPFISRFCISLDLKI